LLVAALIATCGDMMWVKIDSTQAMKE